MDKVQGKAAALISAGGSSHDIPTDGTHVHTYTRAQSQPPFFCLPLELRLKIYNYCLPICTAVHVVALEDGLGSIACQQDNTDYIGSREISVECPCIRRLLVFPESDDDRSTLASRVGRASPAAFYRNVRSGLRGVVSLLAACKRIYSEFIPVLYPNQAFHFSQAIALLRLSISAPAHLRLITHLELDRVWDSDNLSDGHLYYAPQFRPLADDISLTPQTLAFRREDSRPVPAAVGWNVACTHVLPRMKGLKHLKVRFTGGSWWWPEEPVGGSTHVLEILLRGVKGLEKLEVFEVWVNDPHEFNRRRWEKADPRLRVVRRT